MIHAVPIEFYVMLAVGAAAIAAFIFKPAERGPVLEYLLAGDLACGSEDCGQMITLRCREDGSVELVRRGVPGVAADGAVSVAVKVNGTDVSIEERLVPGKGMPCDRTDALFALRFLKRGVVYNIRYNSSPTSMYAAFSMRMVPGLCISRQLRH